MEKKLKNALMILTMPIVVGDISWGAPPTLVAEVLRERKEAIDNGEEEKYLEKATLAEVAVYLYGASLRAPLDSDHTEIYLYAAGKVLGRIGIEVPDELKVEKLSSYRKDLLNELAYKIRQKALRESEKRLRSLRKKKVPFQAVFEELYLKLIR